MAKNQLTLFLKLDPNSFKQLPKNAKDEAGNFELTVDLEDDLEAMRTLIKSTFNEVCG